MPLLPYLEQQAVFDLGERVVPPTAVTPPLAAYGDMNSFVAQSPKVFRCPSDPFTGKVAIPQSGSTNPLGLTNYGVSSGTTSNWFTGSFTTPERYEGVMHINSQTRMTDITDGTSNTILAGERTYSSRNFVALAYPDGSLSYHAAIWRGGNFPPLGQIRVPVDQINPRIDPAATGTARTAAFNRQTLCYSSMHPGGALVVFSDGSVRFLQENMPLLTLQALVTRNGGEITPGN